jgi:hypothetical protein
MEQDMTKDEALDKALYALEIEDVACRYMKDETPSQIVEAITAIKQARSAPTSAEYAMGYAEGFNDGCKPAPVQEPVVFYRCNGCGHAYEQMHPTSCDCMEADGFDRVEYYTTPPAAQRQWVGIDNVEIGDIWARNQTNPNRFAREIEAKLKEKNNG